jgi:hypothetical protein
MLLLMILVYSFLLIVDNHQVMYKLYNLHKHSWNTEIRPCSTAMKFWEIAKPVSIDMC